MLCSHAGSIYTRNSVAEMTAELDIEDTELLADSEGIVVRLRGDGQLYQMLLTTGTPVHGDWSLQDASYLVLW